MAVFLFEVQRVGRQVAIIKRVAPCTLAVEISQVVPQRVAAKLGVAFGVVAIATAVFGRPKFAGHAHFVFRSHIEGDCLPDFSLEGAEGVRRVLNGLRLNVPRFILS